MAAEAYALQDYTTLEMETDEGTPTTIPVAGVTEAEIVPSVSIERLYTGDSIKIEDQLQHEFQVSVSLTVRKWDPIFVEQWLGGDGSESNTMTDTSFPQKFVLNSTFASRASNTEYNINVSGITFEELPVISVSNGEFGDWSLEGVGESIDDISTTTT